jgi:hypothetical protein
MDAIHSLCLVVPPVVSVFWLWREMVFGFTSILRVQYMMARRNRYFKGMEDGQMSPRGYPTFNSYIQNLYVLVSCTDRDINLGAFRNYVPPG